MQVPFVNFPAQYEEEREDILTCVDRVFSRGEFVGGEEIELLESELASYLNVRHVIALDSGTDALMLAMAALGIGPGDEVITPPNSFVASTAAIVQVGAVPRFADVGNDQNVDPDAIERAITRRTKAIMPVHLTGRMARMDAITDIAARHGLLVVEDAAQAIGSTFDGRLAGTIGHAGCFSAHPLKNLNAAGDAGFVATNDGEVSRKIRLARNHGLVDRNTVSDFGRVSRMDTLQAAILRMRLKRLPTVIERRRRNADLYRQRLEGAPVELPHADDRGFDTYHLFVIQADRRDELKQYLASRGIGTAIHYPIPIHLQPAARGLGYGPGSMPNAERQARRILSLPVNQFLGAAEISYVASEIKRFVKA